MIVSQKLQSNYEKLIDICNNIGTASKILSPFVYKKTILEEKDKVVTQEILKNPIKNLTHETEFSKKNDNTIQIKILTGPLSKSLFVIQFNKFNDVVSAEVEISLKTNLQFSLLKNRISQKLSNIFEGLLINFDRLTILTNELGWTKSLHHNGESLMISGNFPSITIHGWYYSSISEIFFSETYSSIPIKGKVVVDIGANIADSSMFFVLNGAKKVIAIEPFPKNFNFAKKNISENHFEDKILLENCVVSDNESIIKIDSEYAGTGIGENSNSKSDIKEQKNGLEIPTHTLNYIVQKYGVDNASLKIDCEGCEYKIFLSSSDDTLKKFTHIIMEYHNGYEKLKNRLEKLGFHVTVNSNTSSKMGILIAKQ
ncbi:MAG: FkbM family methyltransferase [Lutibacter sp.]|nr:FkbM family methyltransferase [Lutibacter sp.]